MDTFSSHSHMPEEEWDRHAAIVEGYVRKLRQILETVTPGNCAGDSQALIRSVGDCLDGFKYRAAIRLMSEAKAHATLRSWAKCLYEQHLFYLAVECLAAIPDKDGLLEMSVDLLFVKQSDPANVAAETAYALRKREEPMPSRALTEGYLHAGDAERAIALAADLELTLSAEELTTCGDTCLLEEKFRDAICAYLAAHDRGKLAACGKRCLDLQKFYYAIAAYAAAGRRNIIEAMQKELSILGHKAVAAEEKVQLHDAAYMAFLTMQEFKTIDERVLRGETAWTPVLLPCIPDVLRESCIEQAL